MRCEDTMEKQAIQLDTKTTLFLITALFKNMFWD